MTREFRNHEQEHAAPDTDLALDTDHDRESARRTSIIGLEREANNRDLPPDILGFAKKEGVTGKGTTAPPKPTETREYGEQLSNGALQQTLMLVAGRIRTAGDRIETASRATSGAAGYVGARADIEEAYRGVDAHVVQLISEVTSAKSGNAKYSATELGYVLRAYEMTFQFQIRNAKDRLAGTSGELQIDTSTVKTHIDKLAAAMQLSNPQPRAEKKYLGDEELVDEAIKDECAAGAVNAHVATSRLTAKDSIDLELGRVAASVDEVSFIIKSHAENPNRNPDASRRLRPDVIKANNKHLAQLLKGLLELESAIARDPQQKSHPSTIRGYRTKVQGYAK